MVTTSRYSALDYLGSVEDMAAYIRAAVAENDSVYFLRAASNVLQAKSILRLSQQTGIPYRTLCGMFSGDSSLPETEMPPDAMERVASALVSADA